MARRDLGSASARERNEECRASNVLDTVESSSPDADAGRVVHAFLYGVNTVGRTKALAAVPAPYRAICEVMDPADYPTDPKAFAAEVALAYHVTKGTARELGRN